ncbi:MAG: N-acetyltransferase [Methanobacteriales archaeon HGW-Methanobacteriales-1]|jgi:ribosomal protein S18 acetylase RimI-like enzyme|nr:MAG: N-acetyltransferase [Methanobacteriales archaeon HGW-Methanobacteriales-1]
MSKKLEFKIISGNDLDLIKPLWTNLKNHHSNISSHFQEKYHAANFENRKEELLKKSSPDNMRVEVVSDCDKDCFVGYCISSISDEGKGEIDSIYLEKEYRKLGLGKEMVKRAMEWMESQDTDELKIVVAVGNEDLLPFYSSFNFFPRHLILEKKEKK